MEKDCDNRDENSSVQFIPSAGLTKLMQAIEKPKAPTEALKRLLRSDGTSKS